MSYKQYLFNEGGHFQKPKFNESELLPTTDFDNEVVDLGEMKDNGRFYNVIVGVDSAEVMKSYLKINLSYSGGKLEGKIWGSAGGNLDSIKQELEEMRTIAATGKWNEWPKGSGKFSMIIEDYEKEDVDPTKLIPQIEESRVDLKNELLYYVSTMSEEYAKMATEMLEEAWEYFSISPAAKGHHHFQLGGLLQHTVENLRLADKFLEYDYKETEDELDYISRLIQRALNIDLKNHRENEDGRFFSVFYEKDGYTTLLFNKYLELLYKNQTKPNRDVVIFSLIFHDIAKIMEYTYHGAPKERYKLFFPNIEFEDSEPSVGVDMDTNGARIGHITLGMMYIQREFSKRGITGPFLLDVLGCLSSHHGRKEWGSPTEPQTAEELLVHICDYVDAKFANEK